MGRKEAGMCFLNNYQHLHLAVVVVTLGYLLRKSGRARPEQNERVQDQTGKSVTRGTTRLLL